MERMVFELASGKFSIREAIWNDDPKALIRIINEKDGRTEVSDFYVSGKHRRSKSTPLEELIQYLEKIQKHAAARGRQPYSNTTPGDGRGITMR